MSLKQLIKKLPLITATALMAMAALLALTAPKLAYADAKDDACAGVNLVTGSTDTGCDSTEDTSKSVNEIIILVINILSWIVGIVAVIMIIVGGFRFVLSGGEANASSAARNTILYAIVGLVIVVLAQIIVQFVLEKVPG